MRWILVILCTGREGFVIIFNFKKDTKIFWSRDQNYNYMLINDRWLKNLQLLEKVLQMKFSELKNESFPN